MGRVAREWNAGRWMGMAIGLTAALAACDGEPGGPLRVSGSVVMTLAGATDGFAIATATAVPRRETEVVVAEGAIAGTCTMVTGADGEVAAAAFVLERGAGPTVVALRLAGSVSGLGTPGRAGHVDAVQAGVALTASLGPTCTLTLGDADPDASRLALSVECALAGADGASGSAQGSLVFEGCMVR